MLSRSAVLVGERLSRVQLGCTRRVRALSLCACCGLCSAETPYCIQSVIPKVRQVQFEENRYKWYSLTTILGFGAVRRATKCSPFPVEIVLYSTAQKPGMVTQYTYCTASPKFNLYLPHVWDELQIVLPTTVPVRYMRNMILYAVDYPRCPVCRLHSTPHCAHGTAIQCD
jgi:hypothetical protein